MIILRYLNKYLIRDFSYLVPSTLSWMPMIVFNWLLKNITSLDSERVTFKIYYISKLRTSRSQTFFEIDVFKNFWKFLKVWNFIIKRLQYRCFLVKFTKFLRKPSFKYHFRWLLLSIQNQILKITSDTKWSLLKMCDLRHRLIIFLFREKFMFGSQDVQVFVFLTFPWFTKSVTSW